MGPVATLVCQEITSAIRLRVVRAIRKTCQNHWAIQNGIAARFVMMGVPVATLVCQDSTRATRLGAVRAIRKKLTESLGNPERNCCKVCYDGRACGDTCMPRHHECHSPRGCACDPKNMQKPSNNPNATYII